SAREGARVRHLAGRGRRRWVGGSPAALRKAMWLRDLVDIDADHCLAEATGDLRDHIGVVVESSRSDNRGPPLPGVTGLEDSGTNEDPFSPELHHHGGVRGCRDATSSEEYDRQLAQLSDLGNQLVWGLQLLGSHVQLIGRRRG